MTTWKNPQTWVCGFFYGGKRMIRSLFMQDHGLRSQSKYFINSIDCHDSQIYNNMSD